MEFYKTKIPLKHEAQLLFAWTKISVYSYFVFIANLFPIFFYWLDFNNLFEKFSKIVVDEIIPIMHLFGNIKTLGRIYSLAYTYFLFCFYFWIYYIYFGIFSCINFALDSNTIFQ